MFATLLVPLDGSKEAEGALEQARFLASAQQGKIILVQACPGPILPSYNLDDRIREPVMDNEKNRELVANYLESVRSSLQAEGLNVEARVLDSGDPAHQILEEVETAQLEGRLHSRDEALAYLKTHVLPRL